MKSSNNNMIMYRFSINLFFILLLFSHHTAFSQNQVQAEVPKSIVLQNKTSVSENVVYKINKNDNPVLLDIYSPKTSVTEKLPVVIYVHGGAWAKGDKVVRADSYIESTILKLVEKNYVVVSIDYTLVSDTLHFPLPVEDVKDAVRWVRKNAGKYNFDDHNIGYFGVSSGAHLSMLSAYTNDSEFAGNSELSSYSAKVNYVVSNFGPTDLNNLLHTRMGKIPVAIVGLFIKPIVEIRKNLIFGISGYHIKDDKRKVVEYFKTVSPVNYAKNGVPTFILHGNKDKIAPIKHSKKLVKKLKKQNIKSDLIVVKDGTHGFGTTDNTYMNELTDEMVNFIVLQKKL